MGKMNKNMNKKIKRAASVLLSAALALGLLAGCQSGNVSEGQSAGNAESTGNSGADSDSVIIAMDPNSEPEAGFDPAYGWGAGEHVHEPLIQSTLTVTNTDLTIGYDLATDYNVSEDGMTWTVTIRDDVSFTDGEPLTAEDVAFTYNTVKETSSVNDLTMLDYAEAQNDTTVIFHMTRPFSIWAYTMAIVGIIPEHAYDSATYGSDPIGSGRYILKQWDRGQQVILEANPDYYGEAPRMQQVTILFMWHIHPPPIPTRRWKDTAWRHMRVWITGDLTSRQCQRAPTEKEKQWEMTLPQTCWCAARSISVWTGRR